MKTDAGAAPDAVQRPQPAEIPERKCGRRIAAVVLAAGRSTRMGPLNKLVAGIGGKPLVRVTVERVLSSSAGSVIVVTGHQRGRIEAALEGLRILVAHNADFAEGLGTSLKAGIAAVRPEAEGVVVCLGDTPQVSGEVIDRLLAAFDPDRGAAIVVPTIDGQRRNPVVWARRYFDELMQIQGDVGARHLIGRHADAVVEVPLAAGTKLTDVDTPESLHAVRAEMEQA